MRTSLVLFGLMLASMTGALTGCNDAERFLEPLPPSQPLAFDPTESYTMSEWWTNGHQLLRLQADRRYLLYGTTNRYDRPVQIGRWSRQSFACLWFEPYSSLRSERLRVAVSKVDDRIALSIADLAPMFGLEAPPRAPQDALFGDWRSDAVSLTLFPNMRYEYRPRAGAPGALPAHYGVWTVTPDRALALQPDDPAVPTTMLAWQADAAAPGGAVLSGDDLHLESEPAPTTPEPDA